MMVSLSIPKRCLLVGGEIGGEAKRDLGWMAISIFLGHPILNLFDHRLSDWTSPISLDLSHVRRSHTIPLDSVRGVGSSVSIAKKRDLYRGNRACVPHARILHRNAAIYVNREPYPAVLHRMTCACPFSKALPPLIRRLASRSSSSMHLPRASPDRSAAMVSGEGLKLPGRWPSAIASGVQPYLFLRFQTSIFAPLSARSCTIFGKLL